MFGPPERALFHLLGIDPEKEYDWKGYTLRFLAVDALFILFAYVVLRLQGHLPLNPGQAPGMARSLAFNTAVSFGTNTNWQAYAGETEASYLTQMLALTTLMFTSSAAGIVVAIGFMRGLSRKNDPRLGNFYADFIRAILRILLPLALVATIILVPLGVVQTMKGPVQVETLEGETQTIPRGPVASLSPSSTSATTAAASSTPTPLTPTRTPPRSPISSLSC